MKLSRLLSVSLARFSTAAPAVPTAATPPSPDCLSFRAAPAGLPEGAIDRAAGTIRGVSLITADREAGGHGLWVDARTVETFRDLLAGRRVKAYATHGTWGKDGTLDEVGYWSNPVIDSGHLRGSFAAFKAWRKHSEDEFDTLFELAETMPSEFGASLNFRFRAVWLMGDGREIETRRKFRITSDRDYEQYWDPPMPAGALRDMPSVRATEVFSADFVDRPAANDGLFRDEPAAPAVDAGGKGDLPPSSPPMLTTKQIHERFSAKPAHVARAIALSVSNDKLTLDEIALTIDREDEQAELAQLRAANQKLTTEAATFSDTLKAKEAEIARLTTALQERDQTIAAFKKPGTAGAAAVKTGEPGAEATPPAGEEARLRAELDAIHGTDPASARRRGELVASLRALRVKKS